jgi:aromatic ring-opening dioxygenase catalytic subunit (LigB family)
MTTTRQPAVFISHGGGPCFWMDYPPPIGARGFDGLRHYLDGLIGSLPQRPRAIVVISAHWEETVATVSTHAAPPMLFDYYGFPPHTYQLTYPAPGAPALAKQIVETLRAAGIASGADAERGFDHGMFIPLKLVFPEADIPVVQLSLNDSLDPVQHLEVGRALQALRDEDVLIIGSGMSFHNMRGYGDPRYGPVSDVFDAWLTETVKAAPGERDQRLAHWEQAPHARHCHPPRAEEHLLPLMTVAGAAGQDAGRKVFSDRVMETTLSAFVFG